MTTTPCPTCIHDQAHHGVDGQGEGYCQGINCTCRHIFQTSTARTIAEQVVATLLVWIGHATTQEAIAHVEPVIAKAITAARAEAEAERDAARAELAVNRRYTDELIGQIQHARTLAKAEGAREALEQGFRAGYHCRWHREQGEYCFDPAMSPGDPDGAFAAWLRTRAQGGR